MGFFDRPSKTKVTAPNLKKYKGESVLIDGERVFIKSIVGNKTKPGFYEINGKYLINMLRLHAQLENEEYDDEDYEFFETLECEIEQVKKQDQSVNAKVDKIVKDVLSETKPQDPASIQDNSP